MPETKNPSIFGVLDYSTFFGVPAPPDLISKLGKYPTDALIVLLAKVNAIIFHSGGDPNKIDNEVFRLVFNKMDKKIYERIHKIRSTPQGSHGAIFTSPPIVGLMAKLIARYQPVSETYMINESGVTLMMMELFEAILAVNDNYYNSANGRDLLTREHLWKLELLQQGFVRGISNMFGVIPLKVFLFFRFMGERYGDNVLKEFATAFGVPSVYNFYFAFLGIVSSSTSAYEADRQPRYSIVDKTLEKVFDPFVYDPSRSKKISSAGDSFVLINQPFYRLSESIIVLDFSFFAHITDISLFYHFYHSTSLKENHGVKNYNDYLGILGKYFFEEYLALQLIQKLATHKYDKVLTEKDDPLYPDILIMQNNKDVFVIEVKSSRVNGRILEQADIPAFENFIIESFGSEKSKPGEKNKGIYQLKKQIQYLKNGGRKFRIFPVIIYTDLSMDISGVNSFLEEKFDNIIAGDKASFAKIYPLTLINLHFFIKYYPQLKKQRYFFRDKIIEYHKRKKSKLKEALKEENPFTYFQAEYSFMRMMEQTYAAGEPMEYFKMAAADFGFSEEAKDAKDIS